MLHWICQQIWKTQQWPQDWKSSVFIPIPRKGNLKECSDYHTIALIVYAGKVMLKILQARLMISLILFWFLILFLETISSSSFATTHSRVYCCKLGTLVLGYAFSLETQVLQSWKISWLVAFIFSFLFNMFLPFFGISILQLFDVSENLPRFCSYISLCSAVLESYSTVFHSFSSMLLSPF